MTALKRPVTLTILYKETAIFLYHVLNNPETFASGEYFNQTDHRKEDLVALGKQIRDETGNLWYELNNAAPGLDNIPPANLKIGDYEVKISNDHIEVGCQACLATP